MLTFPNSSYHNRYFQLKGFSTQQRQAFVQKRRGAYTSYGHQPIQKVFWGTYSYFDSFGAVSLLLGLVPVVGTVFSFTSAAGAAIWASDLEKYVQLKLSYLPLY